ncbi:MAG TPA: CBS domain-containing protein [Nitrososphaerales archaeon]|nr:CBS domain-containing protein [Nitrososphaerales archaeon]HUK75681.1 CBS domain-containing protein [Nitrososphaerales archaeon]
MTQVRDAMTQDVLTTTPDKSIVDAAKLMRAQGRGSIVVVDRERPVAIVTERDFLKKVVAEGLTPNSVTVRQVMSSPLVTVGPTTSLRDAAAVMTDKKIRRLPVVENDRLVGMITTSDFFPRIDWNEAI